MTAKNLGKPPAGFDSWCSDDEDAIFELEEYELEDLSKLGVEKAWYWYSHCCYEGSGHIIMWLYSFAEGREMWGLHDMGHCSCYGPIDGVLVSADWYKSLDEMERACTPELLEQVAPLIEMARKDA